MSVEMIQEIVLWPIEKIFLVVFGVGILLPFLLALFFVIFSEIRKSLDNVKVEVTPRKQPDQKPRRPDLSGKPPKRI